MQVFTVTIYTVGTCWLQNLFAQVILWVAIPFAAALCRPLSLITMFAQILKKIPMVYVGWQVFTVQWRPVSSNTFKTKNLFVQLTFWVPISLATTICHPLSSNTLFAQMFKSAPIVCGVAGFHCNCVWSGSCWLRDLFAEMTLWVRISFVNTVYHLLGSVILFAQILKTNTHGVWCNRFLTVIILLLL